MTHLIMMLERKSIRSISFKFDFWRDTVVGSGESFMPFEGEHEKWGKLAAYDNG